MSIGAIFLALALGGPMEKLISRLTGIKRGSEISDDSE
jgi:putative Mg2+ transporter-C (MgtC) family protein